MITIPKIIIYLSTFIWIFPPLRQFRGRFFYYFLILAFSDPAAMAMSYLKISFSLHMYILISAGLLISIPQTSRYLRLPYRVSVIVLTIILIFILSAADLMLLMGIIHLLILFALLKYAVNYVFVNGSVQLFHLLLISYEISIMLKFINIIFELRAGRVEFFFVTGFQAILGIMFCFIKEESPRLALKFR